MGFNELPRAPPSPEKVLYTVREDFDSPWTTLAKNALHERKLRSWKAMAPGDKVLDKMAGILQQVRGAAGGRAWSAHGPV